MFEFFFDSAVTYVSERLLPILIGTVLVLSLRWLLISRGRLQRGSVAHEIGICVFVLYAAVVLSLTFLPLSFLPGSFHFNSSLFAILQGKYTTGSWGISMMIGNTLMFLPFGFLLPLLWKWFRWFRVLITCLIAILCIELLQPLVGRSFDTDDVILNFAGAAVGLVLSAIPRALFPRFISTLRS